MSAIVRGDCVRLRPGQRKQINFREPLFTKHLCSCCAHAAVTSDRLLPQMSHRISPQIKDRCNEIGGIKIEEKSDVGLDE